MLSKGPAIATRWTWQTACLTHAVQARQSRRDACRGIAAGRDGSLHSGRLQREIAVGNCGGWEIAVGDRSRRLCSGLIAAGASIPLRKSGGALARAELACAELTCACAELACAERRGLPTAERLMHHSIQHYSVSTESAHASWTYSCKAPGREEL